MASFDGKYMTYNLMTVLMSALSLTIYEIFGNQIKCQFHLENEGQRNEGQGENRTCAIQLKMVDSLQETFFRILATWEQMFRQNDIRLHTYTHMVRQVTTIGKICKADLLKNYYQDQDLFYKTMSNYHLLATIRDEVGLQSLKLIKSYIFQQ